MNTAKMPTSAPIMTPRIPIAHENTHKSIAVDVLPNPMNVMNENKNPVSNPSTPNMKIDQNMIASDLFLNTAREVFLLPTMLPTSPPKITPIGGRIQNTRSDSIIVCASIPASRIVKDIGTAGGKNAIPPRLNQ